MEMIKINSKYSEFERDYAEEAVRMTLDRLKKSGVEKFRIQELVAICKAYDINIEDL